MRKIVVSLYYINYIIVMVVVLILPALADVQNPKELELLMQTYTDNKYYNCVCWLTSHNSYAHRRDNTGLIKNIYYINPNQILDIKEQLEFGVRGFMIDLYYELDKNQDKTNRINMAHATNEHSSLHFYEQPLAPFLKTIKEWLDSHPNDIITLHLESYIRNYGLLVKNLKDAGLYELLFNFDSEAKWPTLGWMRKNNKRLVIFSDKFEDAGYGIMYVSDTMETEYDIGEFPNCEKRSEGRAKKSPIFIVNHFYKFSIIPGATKTIATVRSIRSIIDKTVDLTLINQNQYQNLVRRAGICFFQEGQWPNFMAVDFIGAINGGERKITLDINSNNCCCLEANEDNSKIVKEHISQDYYNDYWWQNPTGTQCLPINNTNQNQHKTGN